MYMQFSKLRRINSWIILCFDLISSVQWGTATNREAKDRFTFLSWLLSIQRNTPFPVLVCFYFPQQIRSSVLGSSAEWMNKWMNDDDEWSKMHKETSNARTFARRVKGFLLSLDEGQLEDLNTPAANFLKHFLAWNFREILMRRFQGICVFPRKLFSFQFQFFWLKHALGSFGNNEKSVNC